MANETSGFLWTVAHGRDGRTWRAVAVEATPRERVTILAAVRRDVAAGREPTWFETQEEAKAFALSLSRALTVHSSPSTGHDCPHGSDCPGPECSWEN